MNISTASRRELLSITRRLGIRCGTVATEELRALLLKIWPEPTIGAEG